MYMHVQLSSPETRMAEILNRWVAVGLQKNGFKFLHFEEDIVMFYCFVNGLFKARWCDTFSDDSIFWFCLRMNGKTPVKNTSGKGRKSRSLWGYGPVQSRARRNTCFQVVLYVFRVWATRCTRPVNKWYFFLDGWHQNVFGLVFFGLCFFSPPRCDQPLIPCNGLHQNPCLWNAPKHCIYTVFIRP